MANPPPGDFDPRQPQHPAAALLERLRAARDNKIDDPETLAALRKQTGESLPPALVDALVTGLGPRFAADLAWGPASDMPAMPPIERRFLSVRTQRSRLRRVAEAVGDSIRARVPGRAPKGLYPAPSSTRKKAAGTRSPTTRGTLGSWKDRITKRTPGRRRNGQ